MSEPERDPRYLPGGQLDFGRHPRAPAVASLYGFNATGLMGTFDWNMASGMRFCMSASAEEEHAGTLYWRERGYGFTQY